jgi:hypothetical protein
VVVVGAIGNAGYGGRVLGFAPSGELGEEGEDIVLGMCADPGSV